MKPDASSKFLETQTNSWVTENIPKIRMTSLAVQLIILPAIGMKPGTFNQASWFSAGCWLGFQVRFGIESQFHEGSSLLLTFHGRNPDKAFLVNVLPYFIKIKLAGYFMYRSSSQAECFTRPLQASEGR